MKPVGVLLLYFFIYPGYTIEINNVCDTIPSYNFKFVSENCRFDPTLRKNTAEIITGFNYTLEQYTVTTQDGYILTMQRIPYNKTSKVIGQPIFLQHGAFSSSEIFVAPGKKSLGLILSDLGYDVWFGNTRGNYNSPNHVSLQETDKAFWDYALDELGKYDLPACIDKIAEVTQRPGDIIYVGHSQGTTSAMIYAVLHSDEAAKNLKGVALLAPVIYAKDLPIPGIQIGIEASDILYKIGVTHLGIPQERNIFPTVCAVNSIAIKQCIDISGIVTGPTKAYPPEQVPLLVSFFPQRESLKPINQLFQFYKSGVFEAFDYGKKKNLEVYQTEHPPAYDLKQVKIPVFLFVGENDYLATLPNSRRLYEELQVKSQSAVNQRIVRALNGEHFNHMNFVYADDLKQIIVEPMLDYFNGLHEDATEDLITETYYNNIIRNYFDFTGRFLN